MLTARDEPSFNDRAKDKLLNALIRDFEKSIFRTIDEAVSRKGEKALLIHRLNRVDRKIALKIADMNASQTDIKKLEVGMKLLKSYILRSLPEKGGGSFWGSSKPLDTGSMVANYEKTLVEYIQSDFAGISLLG
jgi:hypothetical protein